MKRATAIYWFGRASDLFTTKMVYVVPADEWNPVMRVIMREYGFLGFVLINIILSALVYFGMRRLKKVKVIEVMGLLSIIVATWNLFWAIRLL